MTKSYRGRPKVVTANHLLTGEVVYQGASGWVQNLQAAELFFDPSQAEKALSIAAQQPQIAVGPYLAEVAESSGHPAPIHYRETFRASGPSNYHHGKQAEQ